MGKPTEKIWDYDLPDIKVGKRTPFALKPFEDFFRPFPERAGRGAVGRFRASQPRQRNYALKADKPKRTSNEDTRTPEELLTFTEAKGKAVTETLASLLTAN